MLLVTIETRDVMKCVGIQLSIDGRLCACVGWADSCSRELHLCVGWKTQQSSTAATAHPRAQYKKNRTRSAHSGKPKVSITPHPLHETTETWVERSARRRLVRNFKTCVFTAQSLSENIQRRSCDSHLCVLISAATILSGLWLLSSCSSTPSLWNKSATRVEVQRTEKRTPQNTWTWNSICFNGNSGFIGSGGKSRSKLTAVSDGGSKALIRFWVHSTRLIADSEAEQTRDHFKQR